ncbi:MAG: hypothetical protein ACYC7D_15930 [Nitrososphaerales archaeon]
MELPDFVRATETAIRNVYKNDIDLIGLKVNERAIAHRFAVYLETLFTGNNIDCEYNRYGEELSPKELSGIAHCRGTKETDWIIPDVLIHVRKSRERDNLSVFEIKSNGRLDYCDRKKLGGMTSKAGKFKYDFGMGIEFHKDYAEIILFMDGQQQGKKKRILPS